MATRREIVLQGAGALALPVLSRAAVAEDGVPLSAGLPAGVASVARLEALPGKKPLIKLTYRPPNYETPIEYFAEPITPNDAFFVRYHLADIPEVDAASWRLQVTGDGIEHPTGYSLDELRRSFEVVELVAVCQCSGNRRGLSNPHVAGVEWGHGAMGNARWTGVRLKDLLEKAGVAKETVEVAFDGADRGPAPATPDFVKSLPAWKALDENTLVAFAMNGEPLPHWNGFPARLVVPGWTGTYWTKHLTSIEARRQPLGGFWMNPAYRIPRGKFPLVDRFTTQETATNTPITEMVVNSLITSHSPGQRVAVGAPSEIAGIAWDAGYGMDRVEISTDDGKVWQTAELATDLGRFSFRQFRYQLTPDRAGPLTVMAKASNRIGQTQVPTLIFNPAGYHNNIVQKVELVAV